MTEKPEGALDSACNHCVCGEPLGLLFWVSQMNAKETFRFGNGGKLPSLGRYRLPICVYGVPVLVWVSVVQCTTLGLLLCKGFQKSIGGRICFYSGRFDVFRVGIANRYLTELPQGHYRPGLMDQKFQEPLGCTRDWDAARST